MKFLNLFLIILIAFAVAVAADQSKADAIWEPLTKILDTAIASRVFPGCVASVFTKSEILYIAPRGHFTYGIPPPLNPGLNPAMERTTIFDMASCTKVIASTSAIALLYQSGHLDLNEKVSKLIPGFEQKGKGQITILNLLLHNAGLPEDPYPGYYSPEFGCSESQKQFPNLTFNCREKCYQALLTQTLIGPINENYLYSDIGLMAIMNIVGKLAKSFGYISIPEIRSDCPIEADGWQQCYFEAFIRKYIFKPLAMSSSMFLPTSDAMKKKIAPTENDTTYRHQVVQGTVHDQNTYAMGGVSGHAGLFSTIDDLINAVRAWLFAPKETTNFLNSTTTNYFIKQHNSSQSSRAIGWNTNANNAPDYGWNFTCGTLSSRTFVHTGYTGTMICGDPDRGLGVILLTNRVYPDISKAKQIHDTRRLFTTTVQQIFDSKMTNK